MKQVRFQGAVKSRKQATHGPVLGPSTSLTLHMEYCSYPFPWESWNTTPPHQGPIFITTYCPSLISLILNSLLCH